MYNRYTINVSVVRCDGDVALATVSSPLCEEETFHIFNEVTSDGRYSSYNDISDRISMEFKANGYNIPPSLICFEPEDKTGNELYETELLDNSLSFHTMHFDVPRDEYNSFQRSTYTFIVTQN